MATVASSTSIPTANAKPPSVIRLIVCPVKFKPIIEVKIASGMEIMTMIILRQLPRNTRIIKDTNMEANIAS